MHARSDPCWRSSECSRRSFLFFPVAHPQDPHHPSEKPAIHCHKCGEPCKGEVLRVQTKHFHIKCFTCKGTGPPASRLRGRSQPVPALGSARPLSTPSHRMMSERAQKPRSHLASLVWDWIRLRRQTGSPQHKGCTGLWVFTEVPGSWRGALIIGEQ